MRVFARGAYNMKGTSKNGNAYDIHNLVIEIRQESVVRPTMTRVGVGMDQKELQCTPECFDQIQRDHIPFPCELDLTVGARVGFRGLESVIEAVSVPKLKAA